MPKRSEKRDTAKAEYIAKKKKGKEVSLRALAGELGVSYQKLHRTAEADTGSADIGEEETQCEPIST